MQLGKMNALHLSFDDLDARDKRYSYKLFHCDRNWEATDVDEMEYLDGFNGEEFSSSYHSLHTRIPYVHYDLFIPNQYVKMTVSGNYLLAVFDEDGYVIITKRFLVVEPKISVYGEFVYPRDVSKMKSHQSIKLDLDYEDFYIRDPMNEISVTVLQNFKWFDAIYNVKPKNVISTRITFDAFDPFIFPALKEFRNFDIRSLAYTSRFVYSIKAYPNKIDVLLERDKKRTYANFISDPDANGIFIFDNTDNQYGIQGAEYANVGFTLESPLPIEDHDVYIIGGFSDWQLYDSNLMSYDVEQAAYTADLLLKQGYYDYYYALVNEEGDINLSSLEGDWYETGNSYQVLVYTKEFGGYFDRLIAMYTVK